MSATSLASAALFPSGRFRLVTLCDQRLWPAMSLISSRDACRVEAHEAVAVDMTAQGGGSALQRQAAVSFYHAFQSWVKGADGVCSPAWVTAELRCTADFRSAGQSDASSAPVESLIIGIDVEVRQRFSRRDTTIQARREAKRSKQHARTDATAC